MGQMTAKVGRLLQLLILLVFFASVNAVGEGSEGPKTEFTGHSFPSFRCSINCYLVYTIAKENEEGTGDSAFAAVVEKILQETGIRGIIVNSRIINVLRKKAALMCAELKGARKNGGGTGVKRLTDKWRGQTYDVKIFYHELDKYVIEKANQDLRGEKRILEKSLEKEKAKRQKVEKNLNSTERECNYLRKRFQSLVRRVAKNNRKSVRGPEKKIFSDYSKQHQCRIKKQLKEDCQNTLAFLGLYNFMATKVEVFNCDTQQYDTFDLIDEEEQMPQSDTVANELTDSQVDNINYWIYIKDKFNISNEAWHELSMKSTSMPSKYQTTKRTHELNKQWRIRNTPGDAEGVQISFKESLEEQIINLQKKGDLGDVIRVKLSGDGTNIGKRLKLVNVTYTILNEKEAAMSEKGNYVLAILKTTENYDNLKESLSDLTDEMSKLNQLKVGGKTYHIEYFLGGDWKFLACVCGLGAANQDYACIWCKCPRIQRYDTQRVWSLSNSAQGARSLEEISNFAKSKKFNCKATPLFNFIPLDHVIIDTLHLFLRIADNLTELFIRELRRRDVCEKVTFPSGFSREKFKHMAGYEMFLKNLGISFEWRINKDTKKLDYRDLTGPEKLMVMQNIQFSSLLPGDNNYSEKLQVLWGGFMDIIGDLKLDFPREESIDQFKEKLEGWFNNYLSLHQAKDVTPYMHALYFHVPEFLKLYENINHFNQQGLEKYNDIASKNYFRSSNHRGISALKQLLFKKYRVQFLEAAGYERVKQSYKCSNCSSQGHTFKTCTKQCKHCNHRTCCSHLVKREGKWIPKCCSGS